MEPGFLDVQGSALGSRLAGGIGLPRPCPQRGDLGGGAGGLAFLQGVPSPGALAKCSLHRGILPLLSQPHTWRPQTPGLCVPRSGQWSPGIPGSASGRRVRKATTTGLQTQSPGHLESDAREKPHWAAGATVGPGASRGQSCGGARAAHGLGSRNLNFLPDVAGESHWLWLGPRVRV